MADNDDSRLGNAGVERLDTSATSDLLEQQQAMEQARLLQRFRELRQWQLQQQEQLMQQQRSQLEMLKQEQVKVQTMLTKEREMQWGGGKVIRQQGGISPSKTPPQRRPPVPANSELFSALMSLVGNQDPLAVTMDQSVTKALSNQSQASSLPVPVMYGPPDPMMDDTSTNPELFSSPGSRLDYQTEVDVVEEGVHPIPDTASEMSDGSYLPHASKKNFIRTQPFLGDMASDTASVRSDGSYIPPKHPRLKQNGNKFQSSQDAVSPDAASLLQTLLQTTNTDTLKQMLGLAQPERVVIPDHPRSMRPRALLEEVERLDVNDNCVSSQYQHREMYTDISARGDKHERLQDRHQGELLDREDKYERLQNRRHVELSEKLSGHVDQQMKRRHGDYSQETDHVERDFNKRQYDLQRLLPDLQGEAHRNHCVVNDVVVEEDSLLEESDIQDVTVEEVKESKILGIDDRPIKPGLGGKKMFEQLLEEQIRQEEERLRAGSTDSPTVKKKPFLRKGQGLIRFESGKNKSSPKQSQTSSNAEQAVDSRHVPEARPVAKTKPGKTIIKPKKSQPPTQTIKSGKDQQSSAHGKNSRKEISPKQKNQPKSKLSPRQQNQPKHSPPKRHDSPPSTKTVSLQTKETSPEEEPFADDASFVSKIRKIEENKKVEEDELEVFELLEDFADNVSFCSNSSVVSRLLRGKEESMTNVHDMKAVIEAKKAEKEQKINLSKPKSVENSGMVNHIQDINPLTQIRRKDEKDTSLIDGVDLDTSSDTITESSSSDSSDEEEDVVNTPKKNGNVGNVRNSYEALFDQSQETGFVFVNNKNSDSNMFRSSDSDVRTSVSTSPTRSLMRKIATKDARYSASNDTQTILKRLAASADDLLNKGGESSKQDSYGSLEKQALLNEMFERGKVNVEDQGERTLSSGEDSDDSITKIKRQIQEEPKERVVSPAFDDEEEWTVTAPQTQVEMLDKESAKAGEEKSSTPPTSRLVARLFPKLKNANQVKQAEKQEQEQQKLQAVSNTTLGDGVQSKILRDKLAELEKEIEKFRNENASLEKLRKDREELLAKLKQEICDFEKEKDEEVRRLEEFRNQEMKKLKQERKLFEQYQKTVRAMPDKREREEIEALKRQLSELQDEVKKKEGRWTSSNNRLRQRLEIVEMENKELKEEIKILEKRRLEALQRESQKKNGIQKSFPRSSTPTEDVGIGRQSSEAVRSVTSLSQDSTLKSSIPHHQLVNGSIPKTTHHAPVSSQSQVHNISSIPRSSQHSLAPNPALSHVHNVSGDAIPRAQPSRPSSVPGSDSQSPDDTSSVGAVVNVPRKQSAKFSSEYPAIDKGDREYEETQYSDGKVERTYTNGAREILFANGTRKEISSDGQSIVVSFFNGDIKQIFPDQRVVYFYADAQTTHTTYPDGLEILQFQNNQIEKHYPDGTKEITFPDQTIKYLFPNGSEESIFPDGTVIRVEKNGDKTMEFPNGQREIHTEAYKKREYPDGTVKTVYPDGRQETRYSTGRIRLKDKDGNVIMDRMC